MIVLLIHSLPKWLSQIMRINFLDLLCHCQHWEFHYFFLGYVSTSYSSFDYYINISLYKNRLCWSLMDITNSLNYQTKIPSESWLNWHLKSLICTSANPNKKTIATVSQNKIPIVTKTRIYKFTNWDINQSPVSREISAWTVYIIIINFHIQ